MVRGKGVRLQRFKDGGPSTSRCSSRPTVDVDGPAGRVFNRSDAELMEWRGDRAQAGRLVPKGFPKSGRFG